MQTLWWILFVFGTVTFGATVFGEVRRNGWRVKVFDEGLSVGVVPVMALTMIVPWRFAKIGGFVLMCAMVARNSWVLWQRYRGRR